MSKTKQLSKAEQEKEKRMASNALEIPPMVRMQTTNMVIRSLSMCMDRHGLPYKSTKGSLVGRIQVIQINGCNCAVIDYPREGISFLIEPSGMVMARNNGHMPAKLPLLQQPEVAFSE